MIAHPVLAMLPVQWQEYTPLLKLYLCQVQAKAVNFGRWQLCGQKWHYA